MSVVYIIVEGQTEEEFINNSLGPYLKNHGIENTIPILLETSPGFYGGDLSFARYKSNIDNFLRNPSNIVVTSLIDFYQLKNDFPDYTNAMLLPNVIQIIDHLEEQLKIAIPDNRFIPYIQLHEFEGLLFTEIQGFDYIPRLSASNRTIIEGIIATYPNPELINNGPTTAPSKRLIHLIPRYKKTFHGPIIALANGINPILAKCPRFNNWVNSIISKVNT